MLKKKLKKILGNKIKIGFWAGDENNFLFLDPIIDSLQSTFCVERNQFDGDIAKLEKGIKSCDVAWFEWGEGPIIEATRLEKIKTPIILRIHRYEVYGDYPERIRWERVNKVIFISPSVLDHFSKNFSEIYNKIKDKIEVVPNGVTLSEKVNLGRKPGKNIISIGRIHYHKNPSLLLQIFKKVVEKDSKFKLHLIGKFCDSVLEEYFYDQVEKLGLKDNIKYYGTLPNEKVLSLLEGMDYYLNSSLIEGQPKTVLEAMSRGVKPIISNYYQAEKVFPSKYLFNTIDEAVTRIFEKSFDRKEYHDYVDKNNNAEVIASRISQIIKETYEN